MTFNNLIHTLTFTDLGFVVLFYLFATLALISAIMVIWSRNAVHSVIFLVLVFCNASSLLLMIEVEYLAMVFLVVYVGAIAVLFLFVVMMLAPKLETTSHSDNFGLFPFVPLVFILFGELSLVGDQKGPLFRNEATSWIQQLDGYAHIESIGQVLYTYYFYYLIVAGLVLLMALVGAIVLTLPNPQKGLDSFNSITPPSLANFSTQPVMEQISRDPRSAVFLVETKNKLRFKNKRKTLRPREGDGVVNRA